MKYTVTQPTPDPAEDSVDAPFWHDIDKHLLKAHEFVRTHPEFSITEFAHGVGFQRSDRAPELLAKLEYRGFIRRTYPFDLDTPPGFAGFVELLPLPDVPEGLTRQCSYFREVGLVGTPEDLLSRGSYLGVLKQLPLTRGSLTTANLYSKIVGMLRYSCRAAQEGLGWAEQKVRTHYAELLAAGLIYEYERDYLLVLPPGHKDEVESMVEVWLKSGRRDRDERWVQDGLAMPDYRRLVATHKAVARAADVTVQGYEYDNRIAKQLVEAIPRERLFSLVGWYVLASDTGFGGEADHDIESYGPTLRLLQKHLAPISAAYLREEKESKGKRFWGRRLENVGLPIDFCDLEPSVG